MGRVDREGPRVAERTQAANELGAVSVIAEDGAALNFPHHHLVQDGESIEAWREVSQLFALFASVPQNRGEERPTPGQLRRAAPVGEEPEVADPDEAVGEDLEEKPLEEPPAPAGPSS